MVIKLVMPDVIQSDKTLLVFGDYGDNFCSKMPDKMALTQAEFVLFIEFVGRSRSPRQIKLRSH